MKVRAKWNLKDESGWHRAGEVFETEHPEAYEGGVDVMEAEPAREATAAEEAPATETPAKPRARKTRVKE